MINNVLEEIKRLKIQRANAQADVNKLYTRPTHFNIHSDNKVSNKINDIYGTDENKRLHMKVGSSDIDTTEFYTGDKHSFKSSVSEGAKGASNKSSYINKFFGIPKTKFANNDNTIYYEKKLGNKTEWDFATDRFDEGEANPVFQEREKNIRDLVLRMKHKQATKIKGAFKEHIKEKKIAVQPPISKTTPSPVTVNPAFNTPLPDPVVVTPAFSKPPLSQGESNLQNLAKKLKSATVIKETMKRRYDMKRYDASKSTKEPHTPPEPPPPASPKTKKVKGTFTKPKGSK